MAYDSRRISNGMCWRGVVSWANELTKRKTTQPKCGDVEQAMSSIHAHFATTTAAMAESSRCALRNKLCSSSSSSYYDYREANEYYDTTRKLQPKIHCFNPRVLSSTSAVSIFSSKQGDIVLHILHTFACNMRFSILSKCV